MDSPKFIFLATNGLQWKISISSMWVKKRKGARGENSFTEIIEGLKRGTKMI